MIRAIGPKSEAKLAASSVAVIGLCGGGSHVCQQLAHMGFGRIVPIDDDPVEEVNLGRMVGSTPADAAKGELKTKVMARLIKSIDQGITVEQVPHRFPAPETLAALKRVDMVVACVDSFLVREQINAFCRRYHVPLLDIGLGIRTKEEQLLSAFGQLIVSVPDSACLRCGPLLSDEVLRFEQTERPPGYDRSAYSAGEPQVVSMNGVLASEAANSALDLVTGYARGKRGARWWLYDGCLGSMTPAEPAARRTDCPACAEQGHGDPP
jgi:molybdopterin/thiamine biosynthesis adenylyltransferase